MIYVIPMGIPAEILERAAYALRVLTHAQRLRLCELLIEQSLCVNELCEATGLKQNAVSQHLNQLRAHGIVEPRRRGKSVYYEVVHPAAHWLLECIETHACAKEPAHKSRPSGRGRRKTKRSNG